MQTVLCIRQHGCSVLQCWRLVATGHALQVAFCTQLHARSLLVGCGAVLPMQCFHTLFLLAAAAAAAADNAAFDKAGAALQSLSAEAKAAHVLYSATAPAKHIPSQLAASGSIQTLLPNHYLRVMMSPG